MPLFQKAKRNNTITYSLEFQTRSLACLTELHKKWYVKKVKLLPADIFDLLNPIALAL
jgi:hypothetical protein